MRIRTPEGTEVPFSVVATAEVGRGYTTIQRTDRQRTVQVTADVDPNQANPHEILTDLTTSVLPQLLAQHPGLTYSLQGESREEQETLRGLTRSFGVALLGIYALMAIPFRPTYSPS